MSLFFVSSIRFKLIAAFMTIVVVMSAISGVQLFMFSSYMKQYSGMLDSIASANALNGMLKQELDEEINGIVTGKKAFADGLHYQHLQAMDDALHGLSLLESDAATRQALATIANTMSSLRERVDILGEQYKGETSSDELTSTYDYITVITSTVEEGVQQLIRQKLLASQQLKEQTADSFQRAIAINGIVLMVVTAITVWLGWSMSKSIAKPLQRLSASATQLAAGSLEVDRVEVNRRDEIGQLCQSSNTMFDSITTIIAGVRETNSLVAAASQGIDQSIHENRRASEEIAQASQVISESLLAQNKWIAASSSQLEELRQLFQTIVQRSMEIQGNTVQSLTLSDEGTATIERFIEQFGQLFQSVTIVNQETAHLQLLIDEMSNLLQAIRKIASQTGILSLNASIEAGRASHTARSFVVIADEIKQLAGQTRELATGVEDKMEAVRNHVHQINGQMQSSLVLLDEGGSRAKEVQQVFIAIRSANDKVNRNVEIIAGDLGGASDRLDKLHSMMQELEGRATLIQAEIDEIAAMGEEQLAALEEVSVTSDGLVNRIHVMKEMVARFN